MNDAAVGVYVIAAVSLFGVMVLMAIWFSLERIGKALEAMKDRNEEVRRP